MIKNFTIQKIYGDAAALKNHISSFEFKDMFIDSEAVFGEITDFNMLSAEHKLLFNSFSPALEVQEDSGFFRKPFNTIHCENVPSGRVFVGICPLTDAKITFYKHIETDSENAFEIDVPVQEILDDAIHLEKFEETNSINLKAGEVHFFSPALWHKIDAELVQVFFLNFKNEKAIDEN